jgi:hypothetical protein
MQEKLLNATAAVPCDVLTSRKQLTLMRGNDTVLYGVIAYVQRCVNRQHEKGEAEVYYRTFYKRRLSHYRHVAEKTRIGNGAGDSRRHSSLSTARKSSALLS